MKELGSLFGDAIYSWQESEDWTEQENFIWNKSFRIGVSKHPLQAIASKAIYPITPIGNLSENSYAIILVEVQKIKVIRTKRVKIWPSYRQMIVRKNWMSLSFQTYIVRLDRK